MDPVKYFGAEMSFSGSHDKTAALVQAGTFEAGALDFVAFDGFVKEKKIDPEICRIVWVTPDSVDYHFCLHPRAEEEFGKVRPILARDTGNQGRLHAEAS